MIGSLHFLIGLKEQKGKLWYPKPLLCHWGCQSIHSHYWNPISATWQKAKTLFFCWCCCKSKGVLSYYHHRHWATGLCYWGTGVYSCHATPTRTRADSPMLWRLLCLCCHCTMWNSTWAGPQEPGLLLSKESTRGTDFFSPALQYAFSVFYWKNLIRSQLARESEKCSL